VWNRRVVEKIEECVEVFIELVRLEISMIILNRHLRVFMVQILIWIEGFYGINWLVCLVSGTCHGALGKIST
jgi:hypothetical protein